MRETHTANHGEIKILFMSSTELNFKTTRQGGIIKNTIKKKPHLLKFIRNENYHVTAL